MLLTDASGGARWFRRGLGSVIGTALGLALGVSVAEAVADESQVKDFHSNSVRYENWSYLKASEHSVFRTSVVRLDHGSASPGKMGARARAYWQGGPLCQATATRYNSSDANYFGVQAPIDCGGYVYSKGFTKTWNGNGYEHVVTYRTVSLLF